MCKRLTQTQMVFIFLPLLLGEGRGEGLDDISFSSRSDTSADPLRLEVTINSIIRATSLKHSVDPHPGPLPMGEGKRIDLQIATNPTPLQHLRSHYRGG